jgi:5-methylcytosine-specific restriction endonuclease McrA
MSFATSPISDESVCVLRAVLLWHGVLGERTGESPPDLSPHQWLIDVVRQIFILIPKGSLLQAKTMQPIRYVKPIIRDHLSGLGLSPDEMLVEIVKRVADQVSSTEPSNPASGRPRKMSIAALRARNPKKYLALRDQQFGRCRICGILLASAQEELDHIIPFRIIGDVADGANWQILCKGCNLSKGAYLSPLQYPEYFNWVYRSIFESCHGSTNFTRYVTLVSQRRCAFCGCTASERRLGILQGRPSGLALAETSLVICEACSEERCDGDLVSFAYNIGEPFGCDD